jgi:hypothetical protein
LQCWCFILSWSDQFYCRYCKKKVRICTRSFICIEWSSIWHNIAIVLHYLLLIRVKFSATFGVILGDLEEQLNYKATTRTFILCLRSAFVYLLPYWERNFWNCIDVQLFIGHLFVFLVALYFVCYIDHSNEWFRNGGASEHAHGALSSLDWIIVHVHSWESYHDWSNYRF